MNQDNAISFFGRTNFRGRGAPFGIRQSDRLHHMYVVGRTGVGKSTLLENLVVQDVQSGRGCAVLDPHGELVDQIRARLSRTQQESIIDFDPADPSATIHFNPLENVPAKWTGVAASSLVETFKKLWPDFWGPRLEHILRHAVFALLEYPDSTLPDILRLLEDDPFRVQVLKHVTNPEVLRFWSKEYSGYGARLRNEAIAPLQNKVGAFVTDPAVRRVLGVPKSNLYWRRIMDEGQVLLVNLSKGRLGEETSALLGALLVSRINLAALSRAVDSEDERRDFFVYLDEFHTFSTLMFVNMLSELRKYHVGLVLAHQYLDQLDPRLKSAVLGNVGSTVVFRLSAADADALAPEFYPTFSVSDLTNLSNHSIYTKLMIDGRISQPFSAETLSPDALDNLADRSSA
jgi:hypothetical protein